MTTRSGQGSAFGSGPEYTVGAEEELMLLDPTTWGLVPSGPRVVLAAHDRIHVKPEIRQCMVEIASRPWRTSEELLLDLVDLRSTVLRAAHAGGALVAAAGVHPFSTPELQPTTVNPRYVSIMAEVAYPWQRALVFGMHVHVAVSGADKAVRVTEALLPDLPLLIALGASSPFWRGRPTGLVSNRLAVMAAVPRTGLPPVYHRFDDYTRALRVLRQAGAVPDPSYVWWDVRCQARLGTIEVRVLDCQPSVVDAAALAGLVQSLVRHHGRRVDAGWCPTADRFVTAENRWLAVRHGVQAHLVCPDGRGRPVPELVTELIARLRPDAEEVGAGWALDHVAGLLDGRTPAELMLRRHRAGNSLTDVVGWLEARTRETTRRTR